jgi:hypothetical protein
MYALLVASLTLPAAQPPADAKHENQNPLYKSLLETGLDAGGKEKVKFPAPTMPDGLDAAKQTAIINGLIGNEYTYENFTRRSVVAPQILKVEDVKGGDPKVPVRRVDVWFVTHGDFNKLQDDKFLDRLVNAGKGNGQGKALTNEDLAKRDIKLPPGAEKREGYGHIEFDFLEKVRLSATGHAMWSRNDESVVAAAEIDPRFRDDKEFPNRWRSIDKAAGKVGEPQPWSGAAMYLKITRLAEPKGAMFIEQHIIFAEPTGWFDGENLLGSKLPIAVQQNVRTMRGEFLKK